VLNIETAKSLLLKRVAEIVRQIRRFLIAYRRFRLVYNLIFVASLVFLEHVFPLSLNLQQTTNKP
jgi:hypothetical protein